MCSEPDVISCLSNWKKKFVKAKVAKLFWVHANQTLVRHQSPPVLFLLWENRLWSALRSQPLMSNVSLSFRRDLTGFNMALQICLPWSWAKHMKKLTWDSCWEIPLLAYHLFIYSFIYLFIFAVGSLNVSPLGLAWIQSTNWPPAGKLPALPVFSLCPSIAHCLQNLLQFVKVLKTF